MNKSKTIVNFTLIKLKQVLLKILEQILISTELVNLFQITKDKKKVLMEYSL